jgi:ABC-type transport system involved in multi-copper enzyme maturation permease subunit
MSTFVATTVTSEVRKLRATRSSSLAVIASLALTALLAVATVLLAGKQGNSPLTQSTVDEAIRAPGQILGFAMLLVGVLSAAGEYRHHTVVPTLLAEPRRARMVAGKVVAVSAFAAAAALLTAALFAAVSVPLLITSDAPTQNLYGIPLGVLTLVVAAAGYGVVGVALGLLLRNQTAALVVALIWQFVIEGVLPVVLQAPGLGKYLPGGAASSMLRIGMDPGRGALPPWQGGVVFLTVSAALIAAATVVTVPRDNT